MIYPQYKGDLPEYNNWGMSYDLPWNVLIRLDP
ncbi:hypothetical protein EVA_21290, partial [gut metagenome]